MSTSWKDRRAKIVDRVGGEDEFARLVAEAAAEHHEGAVELAQIRRAEKLTQQQLAAELGVSQPAVSDIESGQAARQGQLYIATLRRYLRAMDIDLELVARRPDGTAVEIMLEGDRGVARGGAA